MSGFLLDTNVISEPNRPRPDPKVVGWLAQADERTLFLSLLTLGEIRSGIVKLGGGRQGLRFEGLLASLKQRFEGRVLPIDEPVVDRWGRLIGSGLARGVRLPGVDALLAATALHHNLILVTRNVRDMAGTGVGLFNPWEDDR